MPRKTVNKFDHKGFITPPIPTLDDFVYFCVPIPNDPQHIENFLGCFQQLTKWTNYKRTEDKRGKVIADIYRDIFLDLTYSDESCVAGEDIDRCESYSPRASQLTWYPENPFTPNEEVPDGYLFHPWTVVDNSNISAIISEFGLGYKVGDVYTDFTKIPITIPPDFLTNYLGLPYVRISNLVGTGTVKIHLLNITLGGRALIVVDDVIHAVPAQNRYVELNRDDFSLPPETQVQLVIEIEIETDGEHHVDVVFFPVLDDTLLPFYFGGGFRGFELCGFGRTGCDFMSEECCDDITTRLDEQLKRFDKIIRLMEGGATITFNETNLPNDFAVDCSPSDFDKDSGETDEEILADRKTALCLTVARYILATLWRYGKSMNMSALAKADLLLLMDLDAPPDFYPQLLPGNNDHVTLQMVSRIAGTGTTAFENVICAMILGLTGDHNTFAEFKASLILGDVSIYPDVETHWLTEIIVACNQQRKNYTVFARELDTAYDEVVDGLEYECPCEVITPTACTEPLELEFKNGRGLTIDLVGTDLYHFTGDPGTESGGTYVGGCYVRDALGRCLEVYEATTGEAGLPIGWTGQAVSYHFVIGCCGTSNHEGPGGFAGGAGGGTYYTEFYWDCGNTTPVDTYYKVRCKDTSECE